jgi:hypothetical protein
MIDGKCIAVVMPPYSAEKTLEMPVSELSGIGDVKILVDDSSNDRRSFHPSWMCGRSSTMPTRGTGATSGLAIAKRSPRESDTPEPAGRAAGESKRMLRRKKPQAGISRLGFPGAPSGMPWAFPPQLERRI